MGFLSVSRAHYQLHHPPSSLAIVIVDRSCLPSCQTLWSAFANYQQHRPITRVTSQRHPTVPLCAGVYIVFCEQRRRLRLATCSIIAPLTPLNDERPRKTQLYFYDYNDGLKYRMRWNPNLHTDTMVYAFLLIEQAELSVTDNADKIKPR